MSEVILLYHLAQFFKNNKTLIRDTAKLDCILNYSKHLAEIRYNLNALYFATLHSNIDCRIKNIQSIKHSNDYLNVFYGLDISI